MPYFATFIQIIKCLFLVHKIIHVKTYYFNSKFGFKVIITDFLSEYQQNVHFRNVFFR